MKSKICLIRHGLTVGNLNRLYYGSSNVPLADEGVKEVKELTEEGIYLRDDNAQYFTTGLTRTEQTLELIYGDVEHGTIEGLREIDFGDYEMMTHEQLADNEYYRKWVKDASGQMKPPGGESILEFSDRIVDSFHELMEKHMHRVLSMRHSGKEASTIVVCHGGSISAILENLYPGENENFYRWIPDPGHGYLLYLDNAEVVDKQRF
jgi:alpha-ribazole phosphatase